MTDVENMHRIAMDGEQNSVRTDSFAVEQLANFHLEGLAFFSQWATLWKTLQAFDRYLQAIEPFHGTGWGMLGNPTKSFLHLRACRRLDDNAVFLGSAGILYFRRNRENTVLAASPSPRSMLTSPRLIPAMASAFSIASSNR
jgi:hypothetical protein